MRVFIPATFDGLSHLAETNYLQVIGGWGFAVTQQIVQDYAGVGEEDLEGVVFDEASRASLKLLASGSHLMPARRVVVAADCPESDVEERPDMLDCTVQIVSKDVEFSRITDIYVDVTSSEPVTAAAAKVVDDADLGDEDAGMLVADALSILPAWYAPEELGLLLADCQEDS